MITHVKSDNGAREGRYLALGIGAILLLSAIALPYHQAPSILAAVAANEIAVEQLSKTQLPALRELNIALEEVQFYQQQEHRWPLITELADEFIAPFVDPQWQWHQPLTGVYLGHNQQWSLLLDAANRQIWFLPQRHANFHPPLSHYLEHQWQRVRFDLGAKL
ncbi:MAG: hypothetical protein R3Y10_01775 [Ferrimonas sp.]